MTTDKSRADALTVAVTHTIDTIGRQLDLITERAPGNILDKAPVVRSLTAHKKRLEKALESVEQHEAAPAAAQAAEPVAIPAGYALVPIEPTEEMHAAAVRTVVRCTGNDDFPPRVWRAMIAAAPRRKLP